MDKVPEFVVSLQKCIAGFASQMATRFGQPVYLTGSSLTKPDARDVDLRIVLPDDQFGARYGDPRWWWCDSWRHTWGPARQRWAEDCAKLGAYASKALRLNIDLQVYPESIAAEHFADQPRLRVDLLGDMVPADLDAVETELANLGA